jgi:peptidoglycan/LPS O-acetylase OafA/YrhL
MAGHVRGLFFVPSRQLDASLRHNPAIEGLYFLTSLGHQAVMVFFVLSGFFIGASVFRSVEGGWWSWSWYLNQRLSRLWIVLIPALLLTAFWDELGLHLFGAAVYHGLPSDRAIIDYSIPSRLTLLTFLGNVVFLQTISVPTFGSDSPLWSLANEFWYYMLFPCLLWLVFSRQLRLRLVYLVGLACIAILIGRDIAVYFGIWLLGVGVLLAPTAVVRRAWLRGALLALVVVLLFGVLYAIRSVGSPFIADWLVGIAAACVVSVLARTSREAVTETDDVPRRAGFAAGFAGFSYTLYLVHLPLLTFAHAWLYSAGVRRWQPDLAHLGVAAGMALGVLLYAWLLSRVTEARTSEVRHAVSRLGLKVVHPRKVLAGTPPS